MASNARGIPALPSTLIRQRPLEQDEQPEQAGPEIEAGEARDEGQGRAATSEPKPRATRKRRPIANGGETHGRKLHLPDAVYDRLQLLAIQRRTTVSAVATDLLDRNLPRLRIERDA